MLEPVFIWKDKELIKIHPEEIAVLATVENYTRFFMADLQEHIVRCSLSNALKKLPPKMFIRIHRSFVVSINYIDWINKDCLQVGNATIDIGKQYYDALINRLTIIEWEFWSALLQVHFIRVVFIIAYSH